MSINEIQNTMKMFFLLQEQLRNGLEVWRAWLERRPPPTLQLHSGVSVYHSWPQDPIYLLLQEIFVSKCYTGCDFYEPETRHTIVDCGANIGMFTLFAAAIAPGIRIHCFEPSHDTYERLKVNIERNGLENTVSTYKAALWEDNSYRGLERYQSTGRRSFFRDSREHIEGDPEKVECISLAGALTRCEAEKIDLLKMDIEGAELEVLESANKEAFRRIDKIAIEYHEELRPGSRDRIVSILSAHGYAVRIANPMSADSQSIGIIQATLQHSGQSNHR
jgi:FkbM family methyltransferase